MMRHDSPLELQDYLGMVSLIVVLREKAVCFQAQFRYQSLGLDGTTCTFHRYAHVNRLNQKNLQIHDGSQMDKALHPLSLIALPYWNAIGYLSMIWILIV